MTIAIQVNKLLMTDLYNGYHVKCGRPVKVASDSKWCEVIGNAVTWWVNSNIKSVNTIEDLQEYYCNRALPY